MMEVGPVHDDVIDRLRDAATAAGETIEDVPPLRLRATGPRSWLAPIAAAAAVVVAIVAGAAVLRTGGLEFVAGPGAAEPRFVARVAEGDIVIHGVDRGNEVARLDGPSSREWFAQVQAVQDNRVFYAATETGDCVSRLFRFTLGDDGKVASSAALPYGPPAGMVVTSLAVSGDGSKVAYGLHSCDLGGAGQIVVNDTATGRTRWWSGERQVTGLSMSADGRYVAFREAELAIVYKRGRVDVDPATGAMRKPAPAEPGDVAGEPRPVDPFGGGVTTQPEDEDSVVARPTPSVPAPTAEASGSFGAGRSQSPPIVVDFERITPNPTEPPIQEPPARVTPKPAPREGTRQDVTSILRTPSADQVRILDTEKDGSDLGRTRALTLTSGKDDTLLGAVVSADGKRIRAALGYRPTTRSSAHTTEIAEFDTAQGARLRRIARVETGWLYLVDADAGGDRLLVRRDAEYGVVDSDGYRPLITTAWGPGNAASW